MSTPAARAMAISSAISGSTPRIATNSYCARPSSLPRPVTPMFDAFSANTIARRPRGNCGLSWLRKIVAPASTCSVTLSFSWIVPTLYSPGGTRTVPPPAAVQASMAAWHAPVAFWDRSPAAPNAFTSNVPSRGACWRARAKAGDGMSDAAHPPTRAALARSMARRDVESSMTRMMDRMAGWHLEHTYAALPPLFHAPATPTPVREPRLVVFNRPLATALGLDAEALDGPEGAATFAGNAVPDGGRPIAQAYAGHQFGYFTALGDGRAILLGEQITPSGDRVDIQLKGPGRTPFSTRGDGRAALGPMLREYIISEAMHALGIPTTRSLAVVTTGEAVYRDTRLDGAVLTRVAASHIRVGTMQWAAAHQDRRRPAGAGGLHAGAALPRARGCA